ncbi:tRNA adenosine deaminase-associated protein [Nocardioides campestrisoli]|uniref:tRNA adenosine deaminase-associated protein n=1 Tax=Nocardioides campestrisoli TaxID=2736757 RepID=UPI0015E767DD|nr:tRNA adenosine deaminase-associated protein [Nocardioides campestrisoli]
MALAPEQTDDIDFALAAYRQDGSWRLAELAVTSCASVETLAQGLRRLPGDAGALAMVSIDEDFFVMVRVSGTVTRVLLSDVSAAIEWELARSAVEFLGLLPEDDEEEEPAGDLDLVGDLGMPAIDMGVLLDDAELYPDEMLSEIADRLGFGPEFDAVVGLRSS